MFTICLNNGNLCIVPNFIVALNAQIIVNYRCTHCDKTCGLCSIDKGNISIFIDSGYDDTSLIIALCGK